jgi:photosystem II stability/assembly factor-like uncharacterized protein
MVAPPGTDACDFRDLAAFDRDTAVAMVAGQPARIYRTDDGGATWTIVLADARPEAFFDGFAFAGDAGVLFGDAIDGAFCLWTTRDRGATWTPVPRDALPAPLPGEAAFAASGTCVAIAGEPGHERFWIATGGGPRARVLLGALRPRAEPDGIAHCNAVDVPLRAGSASCGGFGLAVDGERVVLVGGDYQAPRQGYGSGACSDDGGATWRPINAGVGGFRSAVAWLDAQRLIAVGSHGTSVSADAGRTWTALDGGFHCVMRAPDGALWAAGSDGQVATWSPSR